jgi:heat shock protein HslJ
MNYRFFVVCLVLIFHFSSCKVIEIPINQSIYKEWVVKEFKNYSQDSLNALQAKIDFSDGENLTFSCGCNTITYSYKVSKKLEIQLQEESSSARVCSDMKLEEEFKQMMSSVSELHLIDTTLFLITPEGANIACRLSK